MNLYSEQDIAYIRATYSKLKTVDIAQHLGRSANSISKIANKLGLHFQHRKYIQLNHPDPFPKSEISFLRSNYKSMTNAMMSEELGRSAASISGKLGRLHLKRTKEEARNLRLKFGKYKVHWRANTKSEGSVSIRKASGGAVYKFIKVAQKKWICLQVYNYEKLFGKIPKDHILRCKDGNTLNCDVSNWDLVTLSEHIDKNSGQSEITDNYCLAKLSPVDKELRNTIKTLVPELIEVKRAQIKLRRKINEKV